MARTVTVEEVKKLAKQYYNKGGDTVVECYTDEDIQNRIDGFIKGLGNISPMKHKKDWLNLFKMFDDKNKDIEGWY